MNEATTTSNMSAAERIRISQMIMTMVRSQIREMDINQRLASVSVDGLPAALNIMAATSALARDSYDFYSPEDGDPTRYLTWFIKSSLTIMTNEYLNKTKPFVISSCWNFFHLFAHELDHGKSVEEIASSLGIECDAAMIKKAAEINKLI